MNPKVVWVFPITSYIKSLNKCFGQPNIVIHSDFFICRNIFWSTDIILLASLLTWMASSLSKSHLFKMTMQWWKAAICSTTLKSSFSPSYGQYCPRCQAGNLRAPTEAAGSLAASLSGHPGPLNMVCRSHMSLCFW